MRSVFTREGWEDYTHWQRTVRVLVTRINRLLDAALRDPAVGRNARAAEVRDRRCLVAAHHREHRLVYQVSDDGLVALQARYNHGR